jgi:C-terminal processing protease CtpA/Prc
MFTLAAVDRPRVLIVDIRRNSGGDVTTAQSLLRHLTEKRFRFSTSSQVKRSKEAKDFVSSVIRIPFRWVGVHYLSSSVRQYMGQPGTLSRPVEEPLAVHPRAEPFFDGPVCVLTGPQTFSAAVSLAEAVKTFGLATIVGEETGGKPNSFGNQIPLSLPRSGLLVTVSTASSVRVNGDPGDFSPVKPDIVVRTTAADIRRSFDPVLERAKSCPPRSIR